MTTDPAITKLNKASVLDLGAMTPFGYHPGRDLGGGLPRDWLCTINRQNLVRFFTSDDQLKGWLRKDGYQPIPERDLERSAHDPFGSVSELSADVRSEPGPALWLVEQ